METDMWALDGSRRADDSMPYVDNSLGYFWPGDSLELTF